MHSLNQRELARTVHGDRVSRALSRRSQTVDKRGRPPRRGSRPTLRSRLTAVITSARPAA